MAQAQGNPGFMSRAASAVGLDSFWKKPEELSPLPGQQQQQQQPPQQGQQQPQQPAGASNAGATNDPETLQNPLDVYKGLFDNSPKLDKDGKPVPVNEPPKFQLDSKTISDAASKIDFMSGLPPELNEKIQSGQMDGQSIQALVSHVAQQAYARSMEHATALTDRFVGMRLQHEQQGLPKQLQRLLAKHTAISNPAIRDNPVLREQYETVSERLSGLHPDKPPEWIAEKTNEYFQEIAKAVNPTFGKQDDSQPIEGQGKDKKVFDWQGYLK